MASLVWVCQLGGLDLHCKCKLAEALSGNHCIRRFSSTNHNSAVCSTRTHDYQLKSAKPNITMQCNALTKKFNRLLYWVTSPTRAAWLYHHVLPLNINNHKQQQITFTIIIFSCLWDRCSCRCCCSHYLMTVDKNTRLRTDWAFLASRDETELHR